MEFISRQTEAKTAANRWAMQYQGAMKNHPARPNEVLAELRNLGPNPTPEDVIRTIGNDTWIDVCCDECGKKVDAVIEIGQEPDYESRTACVCRVCLETALELLKKAPAD